MFDESIVLRYIGIVLKPTYAALDEIPEPLREHYAERDGQFVLALDGIEDVAALSRALAHERAERRNAIKARDEFKAKVTELEAKREELAELEAKREEAAEKGTSAGDAQAVAFQKRIEALEGAVRAEQDRRAQAEQRLADTRITEKLRQAALDIGIEPSIVDDVIQLPRIRQPWRLAEDGEPVVYEGDSPRYSLKDPTRAMPPSEFLATTLKDAKHYFRPSSGAGTVPQASGVRSSGKVVISVADAQDHQKWRRAMEAAQKAGQESPVIIE